MNLKRPLIVLDAETCTAGNEPDPAVDNIITLYMRKLLPDGWQPESSDAPTELYMERNPGIPISAANAAVHGYTEEKVKDWPLFSETDAKAIQSFISGCDLAGFNIVGYDVPLVWSRCYEVGVTIDLEGVSMLDGFNLFRHFEPRGLKAALKFYCGKEHSEAHDARADVLATIDVLEAQAERYKELEGLSVEEMAKVGVKQRRVDLFGVIVLNDEGIPVFNTKRNKGVPVRSDESYARWMLRSDFGAHTKMVIEKILNPPDAQNDLPM